MAAKEIPPAPLDIGIIKPQAEVFIGGRGGT